MSAAVSPAASRLFHPLWIVFFFVILAAAVITFSLPEKITAWLVVGFFLLLVVIHPLHGVSFLLLVIPFFLGNPDKPCMFLLEIFIYGTLAAALIHQKAQRNRKLFPLRTLVLLYLLSAVLSLPLNAKELYYTWYALPVSAIFRQWLSGDPGVPLQSVRVLFNGLTAAGLMVVTFNALEDRPETFITRNFQAVVIMASLISLVGLALLFQWVPRGRTYLSLSLFGRHEGAITALAFNRQFLAQYLLLGMPAAAYLGLRSLTERNIPWLLLASGALVLSLMALAASTQRSVYIVVALQAGFLLVGFGWLSQAPKKLLLLFLGSPLLLAAGLLLLDWFFFNHRFLDRLYLLEQLKNIRPSLWSAAWAMFTFSPFLGIGLGQYYRFFPDFFPGPPAAWQTFNLNRGNAHSVYVQLLAEQGSMGLLFFSLFIAALLILAFRGLSRETRTGVKLLRFALAAVVLTWLVLGAFHHIAYDLRSLEIFFWIFSALILAMARGLSPPAWPGRKTLLLLLVLMAAAFGYQIKLVSAHPLPQHFQAGFHSWEKDSAGGRVRWMGAKAVANLGIASGDLLIECRAPLPQIEKKPQQVRIFIGDRQYRSSFEDGDWKRLRIPVPDPGHRPVLLRLETAYTFNPARTTGSRDHRDLGLQLREFRWATP